MLIITPRLRRYYLLLTLLAILLIILGCDRLAAAPDFQVTRFDGGSFQLSELTGQEAVVINFWYPSCPPCREEMPHFEAVWQDMQGQETGGKDVRFLGLFVPQGFDTEQDARDFVAELGLTFDFATDLQALISQTYEVQYFPTTYFINKKGRVFQQEISNLDREGLTAIVSPNDRGLGIAGERGKWRHRLCPQLSILNALEGLLLVIRWVHAVSAVAWVGGGIFYVLVLRPAAVRSPLAADARRSIGEEFRGLVHTVMAVLLITGIILSASRLTGNGLSLYYVVVLGIKIALAFYMFYVVRVHA